MKFERGALLPVCKVTTFSPHYMSHRLKSKRHCLILYYLAFQCYPPAYNKSDASAEKPVRHSRVMKSDLRLLFLFVDPHAVCLADSFDFKDAFAKLHNRLCVRDEDSEVTRKHFLVGLDVETADIDVERRRIMRVSS